MEKNRHNLKAGFSGRIQRIISAPVTWIVLFTLLATAAGIQSTLLEKPSIRAEGRHYTSYNNYVIFTHSFTHLKNGQDLYAAYPEEYWDLYKYTPTFAAFFGFFALFPDWLGVILWNLLNALILAAAVYYLPGTDTLRKGLVLAIVAIELMTSLQNEQSNGLIGGLLIAAFGLLEKRKYLIAALCIVLSAYVKLFGIAALALYLFYPGKARLVLQTLLWGVILFLVPLLFINVHQYIGLLRSYQSMLAQDHSVSYGYSVMGWLHTWFGISGEKTIILGAGVALFLVPFIRVKAYGSYAFRLLVLSAVLIWIVIFNHKAESPTFVIAMLGVALWFVNSRKSPLQIILFVLAMVFTSLSPTDLFPRIVRESLVIPYTLKAVPCIFIWVLMLFEMLTGRYETAGMKLRGDG
jgi:hypothetical protein